MSLKKKALALYCLTRFKPPLSSRPMRGLKKVALIGMGFSANDKNDPRRTPGRSNEQIAEILYELWEDAKAQSVEAFILAQREVAEALEKNHPDVPLAKVLQEVGNEKHISSHDILGQAWRFAKEKDVIDAILCAQYRHALRSEWNAEMWGFSAHPPHRYAMSYAPESTQLHTRNALCFLSGNLSREPSFFCSTSLTDFISSAPGNSGFQGPFCDIICSMPASIM